MNLARDPFRPLEPQCVPKPMIRRQGIRGAPSPCPAEAGEPPDQMLRSLVPSSRYVRSWAYRDREGRVLCHVARFDLLNAMALPSSTSTGGRPRSSVPSPSARPEWPTRVAAEELPNPRPLYNLDQLALRPDQPFWWSKARRPRTLPPVSSQSMWSPPPWAVQALRLQPTGQRWRSRGRSLARQR
jgi:hypothetical protein